MTSNKPTRLQKRSAVKMKEFDPPIAFLVCFTEGYRLAGHSHRPKQSFTKRGFPNRLGVFENLVIGGRREKRYTQKRNGADLFVKLKTPFPFSVLLGGYTSIFGSGEPSCDSLVTPETAKGQGGCLILDRLMTFI
jgi:hypothetical protein